MISLNRAIVIVLDGCGAGEAPDAAAFGNDDHPSTVKHVWEAVGGFSAPNLQACGFLTACGVPVEPNSAARYGRLRELSQGKDSVTGHWEMMGVITEQPFPTYPYGFPSELVGEFQRRIGSHVLGNKAASGTEIINEYGAEHLATGEPILYTSADSVFQVAAHESVIPLNRLYAIAQIGRELCTFPNNVQRVIARPFTGDAVLGFTRTVHRKDYPVIAPNNLIDHIGDVIGIGPIPDLFGGRGFISMRRTQSNKEHEVALLNALQSDAKFIFANFEDFDMLYGHRNDPSGFARCLVEFDATLARVCRELKSSDILILTADHGNDPTTKSTDHSREYVPLAVIGPVKPGNIGDINGLSAVGGIVAAHLEMSGYGKSLLGNYR